MGKHNHTDGTGYKNWHQTAFINNNYVALQNSSTELVFTDNANIATYMLLPDSASGIVAYLNGSAIKGYSSNSYFVNMNISVKKNDILKFYRPNGSGSTNTYAFIMCLNN